MQKLIHITLIAGFLIPLNNLGTTKKVPFIKLKNFQELRRHVAEKKEPTKLPITKSSLVELSNNKQSKPPDQIDSVIRYTAAIGLTVYIVVLFYLPLDFIIQARSLLQK